MMQIVTWLAKRTACLVAGHRLHADRIYYPPAKSVVSGYRCGRCGKQQIALRRWQEAR